MPVSLEQVLDSMRNEMGRVIIPPHLASREYDSLEEAVSDGVSYMEQMRRSAWNSGDVIASQYLPLEEETRRKVSQGLMPPQERVDALAGMVRHFASQYGVDAETIRRWLKIAVIFPEEVDGEDGPEALRVYSVAINVYLTALEALRYEADRASVIQWALDAVDNDWTAFRLRQEIKTRYDAENRGPVLKVREFFNHELPGDMDKEDAIDVVVKALLTAYAAANEGDQGRLDTLAIRVLARYEIKPEVPQVQPEDVTEPAVEAV